MFLENSVFAKICAILELDPAQEDQSAEKLKRSISVLHSQYLFDALKEVRGIREKKEVVDIFGLVMSVYNRKIREHQTLFLLIHLFEIAIRSKAAVVISDRYSSGTGDDWFLCSAPLDHHHAGLIEKIQRIASVKKFAITAQTSSFDLFNLLSMGDLEWLIKSFWSEFHPLFEAKMYKGQSIPPVVTKQSFLQKFSKIRSARNDIFHNNPPRIKRAELIESIELFLLHLGFNLYDAINNIDPEHKIVRLKYAY